MPPAAVVRSRRPGDFEAARCTCNRSGCVDITIIRADPYVHISGEFLESVRTNQAGQWTSLDGSILTIRGTNRTVRYRILGPAPSWPTGDTVVYEAEQIGDAR